MASAVWGSFNEFQVGILELAAGPQVQVLDDSVEVMSLSSDSSWRSSGYSSPCTCLSYLNQYPRCDMRNMFDGRSHQAIFLSEIRSSNLRAQKIN